MKRWLRVPRVRQITLAWAFGSALLTAGAARAQSARVAVVFRYDDYSAISPLPVDLAVFQLFREHHRSLTVGVVPYVVDNRLPDGQRVPHPLTEERAAKLRPFLTEGSVELALHGYEHRMGHREDGLPTEWAGVPAALQRKRLRDGRQLLEQRLGRRPAIFIPPYNTYDQQTAEALAAEGFTLLSASSVGPAPDVAGLHYLPATAELPEARDAVAAAKALADGPTIVVVLFHVYDLHEAAEHARAHGMRPNTSLAELDGLLAELIADPEVEVVSMGALLGRGAQLTAARQAAYTHIRTEGFDPYRPTLDALIPPSLRSPPLFYTTQTEAEELLIRLRGMIGAYTTLPALLALGALLLAAGRPQLAWPRRRWALAAGAGAALTGTATVTLAPLGYKDLPVICVLAGATLGCALAALRARPHTAP